MIRRTTWIVLIVFAVLLAATLFWQNSKLSQSSEDLTPTSAVQFMLDLDEAAVTGIEIVDGQGKAVALERNDEGVWSLTKPAGEETNTTAVDTAIPQLLSARVISSPSSIKSLAELGLDSPSYVFVIHLDGGTQYVINVGNPTPTGNGYYVLASDRVIYVVSRSNLDSIIAFLDNPPIQPTPTPEPTAEVTVTPEESPSSEGTPSTSETKAATPTPTP